MMKEYPRIESFKELLNEICWSWEYPNHDFIKYDQGYVLNKLYIDSNKVTYKTDTWILADGVFDQFEIFYCLLQATEKADKL